MTRFECLAIRYEGELQMQALGFSAHFKFKPDFNKIT